MMTTAERKLDFIIENINNGNTVALTTATKSTQFAKKNWNSFIAAKTILCKVSDDRNTLLLWEAGSYVDANGAKLSTFTD